MDVLKMKINCKLKIIFKLVFICSCVFCVSCSKDSDEEDVRTLNIVFPEGISNVAGAGYSVCIENKKPGDLFCNTNALVDKEFSQGDFSLRVRAGCNDGYRIKLWTWLASELRREAVYGLNTNYKTDSNLYSSDGYIQLDNKTLSNDEFSLEVDLLPVKTTDNNSEGSSIKLKIFGINESSDVTKEKVASKYGGSIEPTDQSLETYKPSCKAKEFVYIPPTVSEIDGSPTGGVSEVGSLPQIRSGYPTMVIYGGAICYYCELLKAYVFERSSQFRKRMYVYYLKEDGSTAHTDISARPVTEFYDSEGNYVGYVLGFQPKKPEKIHAKFKELTGVDLE